MVNTVFTDTHLPLRLWLEGIWYVTNKRDGTSALGLQRVLGLRSYQTAWRWLHKIRRVMAHAERRALAGVVEVGLMKLGNPETAKALVLILAQAKGSRIGRIRLLRLEARSAAAVAVAIGERVKRGARVLTDRWTGYADLKTLGYRHRIIGPTTSLGDKLLPRAHRVAQWLQGWLKKNHGGIIALPHLDHYLDEFAFRFSRRQTGAPGRLFHQLVRETLKTGPVWCDELVGPRIDRLAKGKRRARPAAR